jgi:hypothetical protein
MPAVYLSTGKTAGDEVSSTYEGRHVTIEENLLIHPYHSADGLVNKGDPVIFGNPVKSTGVGSVGVGVALMSAVAATDLIPIDTEGIWFLNVLGKESDGTIDGHLHALRLGDPVYIQKVPSTNVYTLSGEDNPEDWIPFGYVLGDVTGSLTVPTLVAVKVHWSPNFLENINVGALSLIAEANVISNLEIPIADFRSGGQAQESWGLEYAWMKCFIGLADALHVDEDMCGIYIRLEDDKASTGGDLFAGRFQTHVSHASTHTRIYGLYVAISNEISTVITESFGIAIAMGGAGAAPATQAAIQIMGDGTLGTLQGWFQTEIGRGAGLKANVASPGNTVFEIPILVNGVKYMIPVCAWA